MQTSFEQVAFRTQQIRPHTAELTKRCGASPWVHDLVDAVHLFVADPALGDAFQVELAFNYTLLPQAELELIQLRSGRTVQLEDFKDEDTYPNVLMGAQSLSHLGYHLADLLDEDDQVAQMTGEMQDWIKSGCRVVQLSQTVVHSGTRRRYRYAFVDARELFGTYVKIIQRCSFQSNEDSIKRGREAYRWLSDQL